MIRVLFVCLGNICRSPMAEGVFQDMVNKAGLNQVIEVDSAGTGGWHVGEHAHTGTLQVLKKNGIPYNGRARRFLPQDLDKFDYVLAMDGSNLAEIGRIGGNSDMAHVSKFLAFANKAGTTEVQDVPDPYYDGRFDYVYDLVEKGSTALLAHIRQENGL